MVKYKRIITLLLFFVAFVSLVYAAQDNAGSLKPAPAFKLMDLNGKIVSLADYKGKKAVIVFFWTTWCPYCRAELNTLNQEYAGLVKDSIELLAVNVGEPRQRVANYAKRYVLSFEVLLDPESFVAQAYDIMGVPTYFAINKSGEVVSTGSSFPKKAIMELTKEK